VNQSEYVKCIIQGWEFNNGWYTILMAKPIKSLELHYPMIQFFIIFIIIYTPRLSHSKKSIGIGWFLVTAPDRIQMYPNWDAIACAVVALEQNATAHNECMTK